MISYQLTSHIRNFLLHFSWIPFFLIPGSPTPTTPFVGSPRTTRAPLWGRALGSASAGGGLGTDLEPTRYLEGAAGGNTLNRQGGYLFFRGGESPRNFLRFFFFFFFERGVLKGFFFVVVFFFLTQHKKTQETKQSLFLKVLYYMVLNGLLVEGTALL